MLAELRQGGLVTEERARLYSRLLLLAFALAGAFLFATAHGLSDYAGRPLGSDFSSFYAAGRLMLAGHSPYDQAALRAMEGALFGKETPFYSFAYPPIFLLILAPLARLPYLAALAVWQGVSLLLYLTAMLSLWRKQASTLDRHAVLLAALAFGAVWINLVHGQNGFLTAALFAFGLAFLDDAPLASGVCFGLLAIKPQLGLLVPFALASAGRWRAFAAAALSLVSAAVAATLTFGWARWPEFLQATQFSQAAILDLDAVGYEKMVSVFAALRLWGMPLALAYAGQLLVSLTVIAALFRLWRGNASPQVKGAALCLGALLATPFALDYDLMLLAPAILLLAAGNQRLPFETSLIALIWLMPLAVPSLALLGLPVGALATATAFVFCLRHRDG